MPRVKRGVTARARHKKVLDLARRLKPGLTMEDVQKSPYLIYPMRMLHLCPQSSGACAVIFACEAKAKKISKKPVWVKDHWTCHKEMIDSVSYLSPKEFSGPGSAWRKAAEVLYQRNGITNPLKQIDLFEMYDPTVWYHLEFLQHFLMIDGKEVLKMVDRGDTARDGKFPVCPSGGVVATPRASLRHTSKLKVPGCVGVPASVPADTTVRRLSPYLSRTSPS